MIPGLRADAARAAAGDARAAASVYAAPAVAAWCRGVGALPAVDAAPATPLRQHALAADVGRVAGSFAWGDQGGFGLAFCRAVGSDDALAALAAPLLGAGILCASRDSRRTLLDALPPLLALPTRRAFDTLRAATDARDVLSDDDRERCTWCIDTVAHGCDAPRGHTARALAGVVGDAWSDELDTLAHHALDEVATAPPSPSLFLWWRGWFDDAGAA